MDELLLMVLCAALNYCILGDNCDILLQKPLSFCLESDGTPCQSGMHMDCPTFGRKVSILTSHRKEVRKYASVDAERSVACV